LRLEGTPEQPEDDTLYVVLKGADKEHDFKIERKSDGSFTVTDLESKKESAIKATNFDFDYGSLLRFDVDGKRHLVQFEDTREEVNFRFSIKGSDVECAVYNTAQYKLKGLMSPPKKIDHAKSVLSPMPGAIVHVSVEVGQNVVEGQELLVIEAMKMQNIIKSQVEGKVKKINIKAGVSVAVDQLLIEFE
jgi:propionyl-CoA carboxylase alpha chain